VLVVTLSRHAGVLTGESGILFTAQERTRAYMQRLDRQTGKLADWVRAMLQRRHSNVVACALTNKLARTAWALVVRRTVYTLVLSAAFDKPIVS
jgi:hypothetical protein